MGTEEIRSPLHDPFSNWDTSALWICMKAQELKQQYSDVGRAKIVLGKVMETFKFLAPDTIMESINHEWTEFESMQSRLAEKVITAHKLGKDLDALRGISGSDVLNVFKNPKDFKASIIPGSASAKMRVDTPLIYSSSQRREWSLEFHLVAFRDPSEEVVKPVKMLMEYSTPELVSNTATHIELPYIFDIYTYPDDFIRSRYSALVSVQPTWEMPYIDGVPSSCKLTLTFRDLSPLFKETIRTGSKVNVIYSQEAIESVEP